MRPARASAAVAVVSPAVNAARALPQVSDELSFDFGEELAPQPKKPESGWRKGSGGVKAAILRWLEEQA